MVHLTKNIKGQDFHTKNEDICNNHQLHTLAIRLYFIHQPSHIKDPQLGLPSEMN